MTAKTRKAAQPKAEQRSQEPGDGVGGTVTDEGGRPVTDDGGRIVNHDDGQQGT